MKKILGLVVAGVGFSFAILSLTSCAHNETKYVVQNLDPVRLYESYETKSMDLKALSKCISAPTINIISVETREEDYLFYKERAHKFFITPKEFMDSWGGVADYIRDAFEKSNVKVNKNSPKVIQVSTKEVKGIPSRVRGWVPSFVFIDGANLQLEVSVPERKYVKIFSVEENSSHGLHSALANAVHVATMKILEDSVIQDYILCK